MKKFITIAFFTCMFFSVCTRVDAQVKQFSETQAKFQEYAVKHLQEKIFVHTDKDFYVMGETLWFKMYNVDGTFHKPLSISRIAYVEIINADKVPVIQSKIRMVGGKGQGSIALRSLFPGRYTFRAYTRWMRNESADLFFKKEIVIADPEEMPSSDQKETSLDDNVDIQFFPEGGTLVYSLPSKVAFKVTDPRGNGLPSSGVILNEKNDTLVHFKSLKFGMGAFDFTPSEDHRYRAIVRVSGNERNVNLPPIAREGYVMRLNGSSRDSLRIRVSYVGTESPKTIFLLAHTRQFQRFAAPGPMNNKVADFRILKSIVGDGITHFTVFNENQVPVCERLYFKKPLNKLSIQTSLAKNIFSTREPVSLNINTSVANKPLVADLSLSVYLVDSLQSENILQMPTYLMLSSDLKGRIESPDYYLTSDDSESAQAADNLMLTQGWRRLKWSNVFKSSRQMPLYTPEHEGMIVRGTLSRGKAFAPNVPMSMTIPGSGQLYSAKTNASGKFQFHIGTMYGVKTLVAIDMEGKADSRFQMENPYEDSISIEAIKRPYLPGTVKKTFYDRAIYAQVTSQSMNPVTISRAMEPDSIYFYGKPDASYNLNDYVRFPSMEDVLREYVPEVIARRQNKKLHIFVFDKDKKAYFTKEPLILVDGVPFLNSDVSIGGNARTVQSLEVFNKKFFHGPLQFDGIISMKTSGKDFAGFELDSSAFVFSIEGMQQEREFYKPRYQSTEEFKSRKPDFRNVLHWEPVIKTDREGKRQIIFYTSDAKGRFIGVLHGITEDGLAGTESFTFQVRDDSR